MKTSRYFIGFVCMMAVFFGVSNSGFAKSAVAGGLPALQAIVSGLEDLVADLQDQIDNIQLLPGPQGADGADGENGPAGADGPVGPQGPV